ncbi:uncharacterized protein TNCV_4593671 [Trichonephila clavipes]|uniref:Uncharacterized protein n=1 Tax=Trichonephila clavipes TaxID=2585209 RepID=A0A8X6WF43_TRICX|nr:uncharacterized protein TNCV_4593671 [Trichonephila clavipes]
MACCIEARLANSVRNALDLPDMKITFWTESSVALWWIKEHGDWSVFVTNRMKEIKQLTRSQLWHHMCQEISTRQIYYQEVALLNICRSLGHGSNRLLIPSEYWPLDNICYDINKITRQKEEKPN